MATKLIITEEQLKTLMERKHQYVDNTPEGEVEEEETNGPNSAIITLDTEEEEEEEYNEEEEDDSMMSESIKAVKANFKRFL